MKELYQVIGRGHDAANSPADRLFGLDGLLSQAAITEVLMRTQVGYVVGCALLLCVLGGCGNEAHVTVAPPPANVTVIATVADFDKQLTAHPGKLIVIDFHAEWCGPCKILRPELNAVAALHPELVVLTVDVDQVPQIADRYSASTIPLLVQIKDGKEVKRQVGATSRDVLTTWLDLK